MAAATATAAAGRRPIWRDLALASLTTLGVLIGTAVAGAPITQGGTVPMAYALGLLLLLRRRRPVGVLLASLAVIIGFRTSDLIDTGWVWPASVIFFLVATDDSPGRSRLPWAVGAGLFQLTFAVNWQSTSGGQDVQRAVGEVGAEALGLALLLAVAVAYRNWLRWRTELAAGLAHAAQERKLEADRRAAEERLQIARELHDVVAHTLTVVGVQLRVVDEALEDSAAEHSAVEGSAPGSSGDRVAGANSLAEARAALRTAQEIRAKAVADLRSLIDVLRRPGDRPGADAVPAPQVDLGGLDDLAARTRASGLEVVLDTSGDPGTVSAPVTLACYRVIQESLTNTVRHANARRATVRLHIGADSVDVRVVDDGTGPDPGAVPGHGLGGMRERVAALGGTFSAGAAEDGGYAVHATIPVAGFRP